MAKVAPETLRNPEDVARACTAVARLCPVLAGALERYGVPEPRVETPGFAGLAHIVIGQQVSVASAAAIWARFAAVVEPLTPAAYLALSADQLASIGLSAPKRRTLQRLATALIDGIFDPERLTTLSDADVTAHITNLSGFGPWSADIYLMFCLGRADAFAAGDLALQAAAQHLFDLPARPDAHALAELAQRWRPWRGAAALILWRTYRFAVRRSSAAPLAG